MVTQAIQDEHSSVPDSAKRWRLRKKAQGCCLRCGLPTDRLNRDNCTKCQAKVSKFYKKRYVPKGERV